MASRLTHRLRSRLFVAVSALAVAGPAAAADQPDLTALSLEALLDVEVTSVSRRAESLTDAAAAVFVISGEDLRRSGATSIPEALRMVPGVQVGRIDANKWAVTARGFNGRFANKLLVLVDGRSVYTPLFSGVYWDVQDTLLEDVERIEVIRGPGATLWGANAVNGVINIITKSALDTRGTLVSAGYGTEERGFAAARFGGSAGASGAYRVYAKGFRRDGAPDAAGGDGDDAWHALRAGFRSDWTAENAGALTLQGDLYRGEAGTTAALPTLTPPYTEVSREDATFSGGNLLARWTRSLARDSELTVQGYYDRTLRDEPALAAERRDTLDLDAQHAFRLGRRHALVWGLGYRWTRDRTDPGASAVADPDARIDDLVSGFVQDDITLWTERFRLILGSKFEHNDYTGAEVQPTARAVWTPSRRHTLWAAVSRAVRTPSRGEADGTVAVQSAPPGVLPPPADTLPLLVEIQGNADFTAETVVAWELGYRLALGDTATLDLAGFVNDYRNLRSAGLGPQSLEFQPVPHVAQGAVLDNDLEGRGYGVEAAAEWRCTDRWLLQAAYTYLTLDLRVNGGDRLDYDLVEATEGGVPRHQFSLRSQLDLTRTVEADLWLRAVDDLPAYDDPDVGGYLTLDARLGWRPAPSLELALVGRNLLDGGRYEAVPEGDASAVPTEVERSVYAKLTWSR